MKTMGGTHVRVLPIPALTLALTVAAAAWKLGSSAAEKSPVTFNRDIAPILFRHCSSCHRPGESAPFSLLTYDDAKSHGRQIAFMTKARIMPPWLPAPQKFRFTDNTGLSDSQIALIQEWVDQGEVRGAMAALPPQPGFVEGWQLGPPDLIVKAEKPFLLSASGSDMYWNFVLRVPLDRTRWVKAVEIRPGDKRLVHHANILVDRVKSARHLETSPGSGFAGMELRIESEVFDPDSHFLFWKPGSAPYVYPEGMALRIDKGTDLVLNTHLQPSGKSEEIQPSVGLYFTDQPATKVPMLIQMQGDAKLDIPPGDSHFVVSDAFTLPLDVDLLGVYPHAHYLGKDLEAFVTFPDGASETLIHIAHWDLNWQAVYRYEHPVFLPKGTSIMMRYTYDNSDQNLANPNRPPIRVQAGNRARDEMAHLWLQVLPKSVPGKPGDLRMILQEALARHNLERDPKDFESHYNLGAMLQSQNQLAEAGTQYELALQIRPGDAIVNNSLGAVLLAQGRVDDAVKYLSEARKARPDYFDARYNLGNAFASQGNFPQALEEFQAAVALNPEDANAEADLGSALAETGRIAEAKAHFERALAIDPNNALARGNLQELEQQSAAH
jgi:tetratricopeptide (TPR) repeat protein/mono/diheme cytochrome c family protein